MESDKISEHKMSPIKVSFFSVDYMVSYDMYSFFLNYYLNERSPCMNVSIVDHLILISGMKFLDGINDMHMQW